jgi:hypothetical protein
MLPRGINKQPYDIWPLSLIPQTSVSVEPGTSMGVKVAPSFTKPWRFPPVSENIPTIWPLSLIL